MSDKSSIVLGCGPVPCEAMFIGEAPGETEFNSGRPFIGRAGKEQARYLSQWGVSIYKYHRTNVCKEYKIGNPDPTLEDIEYWSAVLEDEILRVQPNIIVAVGRFAARWFLGESAGIDTVGGIVCNAGDFDVTRKDRAQGAIVIPVHHPALGLYDAASMGKIDRDYQVVAETIKAGSGVVCYDGFESRYCEGNRANRARFQTVYTDYYDKEDYIIEEEKIALDTEDTAVGTWVQISTFGGSGRVLQPDSITYKTGLASLQTAADNGVLFILHNAPYDIAECLKVGLDLMDANIFDTMTAAYLLRTEPQALKSLAWRMTRMHMKKYSDVVGQSGLARQIEYLNQVVLKNYNKPEPQIIYNNDGTQKVYKPQSVSSRAKKIVKDVLIKKVNKDGDLTDPFERWNKVGDYVKSQAVDGIGPMPISTLSEVDPDEALYYAARDADAAYRSYEPLQVELEKLNLTELMGRSMAVLPCFIEIEQNGMPTDRPYFVSLYEDFTARMVEIQQRISVDYFDSQPINPGSRPQVVKLLNRHGLVSSKLTPGKEISTSQAALLHLSYTSPVVKAIFAWRHVQHLRDSFISPVLSRVPEDAEVGHPLKGRVKTTRTTSRRIAMSDPNLLAIPKRGELGKMIREGYRFDDTSDQWLGSWDLSTIEMCCMAHESEDKLLCQLLNDGVDTHRVTAGKIFDKSLEDISDQERTASKSTAFGIIYGIGDQGLFDQLNQQGLSWTLEDCAKMRQEYLQLFWGVADYIQNVSQVAQSQGLIRDHWGMIRYLPAIRSKDRKLVAEAGRHAVSHRIQGLAQGMIQNSMIHLWPLIRQLNNGLGADSKWRLQLHDELIFSFSQCWGEAMGEVVIDALTRHCGINLKVPVKAEGRIAKSWGGLE